MRVTKFFFAKVNKMVDFYAQFNPSPLSIKQFIDFGKLITFSLFYSMHSILLLSL